MNALRKDGWYAPEATTFGDRLSGAREEAALTQEELARRLGVKLKTLRNWEEDLSEPRANKLSMMAGMLNVSLLWLLTGEGQGPDGPEMGELPADIKDLFAEFREVQSQITNSAERLGQLERQLRTLMRQELGE